MLAVSDTVDSDGFFYFCYYNTEQGETSWFAPDGSSPSFMYDQAALSHPVFMRNLPPPLPAKATVGSPTNTGWFVLFVDAIDGVLLYHGRTGHVRLAPWICLRDEFGCVYFGNLMTGVTRGFDGGLGVTGMMVTVRGCELMFTPLERLF